MKRKLFRIVSVLFVFVTGCKAGSFKPQEKSLELMGNPTTGYTWNFIIGDESVIAVDEKVDYLGEEGMTGAPSLFSYSIRSLNPGNTSLSFEYKRPWENKPAEQGRLFEVHVKENGKIIMNEKEWKPSLSYKSVSMNEGLKLMKEDQDFVLLDVRRPDEYAAGHIPGAVQLTNETFTAEDAAKVIRDKSQTVYVYCRSGRRSKQASQKLVDSGYKNIIEIGGIIDYSGEIEK